MKLRKVDRFDRESKYLREHGRVIYCPNCDNHAKVYHFRFCALACSGCNKVFDKHEWKTEELPDGKRY